MASLNDFGVTANILFFITVFACAVIGVVTTFFLIIYFWGGEELLTVAISSEMNPEIRNIALISMFIGPIAWISIGSILFAFIHEKIVKKDHRLG